MLEAVLRALTKRGIGLKYRVCLLDACSQGLLATPAMLYNTFGVGYRWSAFEDVEHGGCRIG